MMEGSPQSRYNGQKHLIRDVLRQRCAWNPLFGEPKTVTTVDRYQGQQNDYIIISLVRTEHVGHIRDVRRLVVACSRDLASFLGFHFVKGAAWLLLTEINVYESVESLVWVRRLRAYHYDNTLRSCTYDAARPIHTSGSYTTVYYISYCKRF